MSDPGVRDVPDFQALFESAPDRYLVLDPDLTIAAVSGAFLRATLTRRDEILGRPILDVFPDNPEGAPAATGHSLRASLTRVARDRVPDAMAVQTYYIGQRGPLEIRHWRPVNAPVLAADGSLTWILHTLEDVTGYIQLQARQTEQHPRTSETELDIVRRAQELQEANAQLRHTQSQLSVAQRLARLGSFEWDAASRAVTMISGMGDLLGEPAATATTLEGLFARVHPEDWPSVQQAFEEASRDGRRFAREARLLHPGGMQILDIQGEILIGARGAVRGVLGVCQDITRHRHVEDTLRDSEEASFRARDEALQASRLKSQFLANMSHEIRTPMNGVLGLTHVLLGTTLDTQQRSHLLALRESGNTLLTLLNDILDVSKVEAGRLDLESIAFNLPHTVEHAMSLFASQTFDKGLSFALLIDQAVPAWVQGDPVRLEQILNNLVANAVKFTATGGIQVRVLAAPQVIEGPGIRFEVIDTGIGIDPQERLRLLQPFMQANSSTTRKFGGTGLGLAISRQLSQLMGGILDFESEPGSGTRFWFEVPLEATIPPTDTEGPDGPEGAAVEVRARPAGPGGRVLLVEDAEINRVVALSMLERLGYQVDAVTDGAAAVAAARTTVYDVILMDCSLPVMDGFEATRRIRAERGPDQAPPIVALTASAMVADRERCTAAGMVDYLSKPLDPGLLGEVLERVRANPGVPAALPADLIADARDEAIVLPDAPLDPGFLEQVQAFNAGSRSIMHEAIHLFLESTPDEIEQLRQYLAGRDADGVFRVAHGLKGSAAVVGARGMIALCGSLEHSGFSRNLSSAPEVLADLEAEFLRVSAALAAALVAPLPPTGR